MADFGFRVSPELPQGYANRVLNDNWYEDRFLEKDASATGRRLKDLTTKDRTTCQDFPPEHAGLFQSTQRAAEAQRFTTPPPAKVVKPQMFSSADMERRLATQGIPKELHYKLGPNAMEEATRPALHETDTTNQHFYVELPAQATSRNPEFYKTDQAHAVRSTLKKDTWTPPEAAALDNPSLGGKGARGEITRNPKEGGNVYGVSVFVDEYSKWGTVLKGTTLLETIDRKQTKYF